jgi:DNA-binding MarR family transcriptional regulator
MTRPVRTRAKQPTAPTAAAAAPQAPADPLAFQLLNEVGIISQLAQNRAARLLAPALNLSQFTVLNHFTRLGGERSLVQLANAMQVTKGAMTNTVARLQAKGLVVVEPDPQDGRGKRVSLTAAGQAEREAAVRQLVLGLAALGGCVTDPEIADALVVLRKLRMGLDANR